MKLRKRLVLVSAVCLAAAGWAISDVALKSSIAGFAQIEQERAELDLERVHEAFRNGIAAIHTKSADWANWDDTFNFVADQNPEYVESNLDVNALRSIRIDLLMILDREGKIIKAVGVPDAAGQVPDAPRVADLLQQTKVLLPNKDTSGFVTIDNAVMLLSVRPVFPTSGTPPGRGFIVFGQRLDAFRQTELRQLTRQEVTFRLAGESERHAVAGATGPSQRAPIPTIQEVSEHELLGSTVATDLFGRPSLIIETRLNRPALAFGKTVGRQAVERVLVIGAIFGIIMVLVIERFVLCRIRSLHGQIAAVGSAVDGTRIRLEGRDELTDLATQVNTMLARIENGSRDLRVSEERLREQNENLEELVLERTREIEAGAEALRRSREDLRKHNENLEKLVATRTRQIEHQAFHDELTGLPNRALFMDRLAFALGKIGRANRGCAVLFIDLDNFKVVNDSLGHDNGDLLLITVAERITRSVRPGDTVARLGGDEFTVILEDVTSALDAREVVDRILDSLRQPISLGSTEAFACASIGLALGTKGLSAQDVVKHADTAMYQAKASGKGTCVVFDAGMSAQATERLELETALRKALDQGGISVAYQPIIALDSGTVVGAEALARWHHPGRGTITPGQFIPIAEETGLIVPLGNWILEEACRQAADWIKVRPDEEFTIDVNVSGRQLKMKEFVARVDDVLGRTGLPAKHLKLEITESVLLDDRSDVIGTMQELKALGIKLALDDFGTGFSSLSTLRTFPIDTLKVDRDFIRLLGIDESADAIVEAIASLAHTLKMDVTGEGVETEEQASILTALGVRFGQGYLYAQPMDSDSFAVYLALGQVRSKAA